VLGAVVSLAVLGAGVVMLSAWAPPVMMAREPGLAALHAGSRTVEPADRRWMPPLHQAGDLRARGSENPAWAAGPFLSPSSEQAFAAQANHHGPVLAGQVVCSGRSTASGP
jgi:hypothetical protein